jgi:S-formylglutathione hydrolase FrmB
MRCAKTVSVLFALTLALFSVPGANLHAAAKLDVIEFTSSVLKNNPLGDPATRRVAVLVPEEATRGSSLPVVYFLEGFGGSSEGVLKNPTNWLQAVERIAINVRPMYIVIPDARTRWGCSQYLNSSAQGNYADYICDEVVAQVESRYHIAEGISNRIIAGHSSGGFGALRLGMAKTKLFGGVIALSPDSDFETTHLPLVRLPGVTNTPLAEIRNLMQAPAGSLLPKDGDLRYALALSAAYAPRGRWHPGQFEWICDSSGRIRTDIWKEWLANDPLTLVTEKRAPFRPWQKVYVEGAAQDQFKANIGARKIYEALLARHVHCAFYEPPGKHGDHKFDRLQRGLAWIFDRPMMEISQR